MTRRRRILRALLIAIPVLFILYTLAGFFGVPLLITKVILPKVSESLHGEVRVAKAACNPFVLSLTLEGLEVVDEAGARLIACDRIHANAQISSIWRGGPHLRELSLDRPFVAAELDEEGKLNLAGLVPPGDDSEPPAEPGEPWRLSAEKLAITGGRVEFRDRTPSTPFEVAAAPIDVVFEHFDTHPDHSNVHRFTAALESGGTFTWEGDFFLDPLSSQGRIELAGLALEQFRPYLADITDAELTSGVTGVTLGYRFAPVKTPQVAEVTLERYTLADLVLRLEGEPLLELREVSLDGVRADAVDRRLTADALRVAGVRLRVERGPDGTFTVRQAVGGAEGTPGDAAAPGSGGGGVPLAEQVAAIPEAPPSPIARVVNASIELLLQALNPWTVQVERVALDDAALQWTDRGLGDGEVVEVPVEAIHLEAGPIRSDEGYRVPLTLSLRVAGSGLVEVAGHLGLESRGGELEVRVDALPLPPLSPYVSAAQPEFSIPSGAVSLGGRLTVGVTDPTNPQLTYAGDLGVASLRIDTTQNPDAPLLAWDDLRLTGIRFDQQAATAHVDRIELQGLAGAVTRSPAEAPAGASPDEPASPEPAEPLPYAVTVGEVHATSGELVLIDRSVEPAGRLVLAGLDATVRNLDSSGQSPAEVELRGTLQGEASLEARGTVTPRLDAPGADLALKVTALPMTAFSGYTGEYVGFPVESGRLGTEVDLSLAEQQLDAEVLLALDRFYLGDRLEDTEAPNLPIKLGLGLLRDRNEQIELRVPIEGDLSDPSVRVGHLVVQAIVNTLVKIAASPFDFLAGAVGGVTGGGGEGDVQLDRLVFEPGSAAVGDQPRRKLEVLAKALRDRPALSLLIHGGAAAADEPALRREALMARIRADLAERLPSEDPRRSDPSRIVVPAEQYRFAVERLAGTAAEGEPPALDEAVELTPQQESAPRRPIRAGRARRSFPTRPAPVPADAPATQEATREALADAVTAEGVPFEQVEASVLEAVPLPADALPQLARRRAEAVREQLVEAGVEAGRVRVAEEIRSDGEEDGPVVRLELQ